MKKMLLAALACLLQDVLNRRLLFKTNRQRRAKYHPIISSFLELGRKLSMQPKFVAAQKILLNKPANIRKWIARFYYFRHLYSAGSACVCSQ